MRTCTVKWRSRGRLWKDCRDHSCRLPIDPYDKHPGRCRCRCTAKRRAKA